MQNKKNLICIIAGILIICLGVMYVAFSDDDQENKNSSTNTTNNIAEEAEKTKLVVGYLNQLEASNSIEEINNVIGVEGTKSEYSEEYTWKLSNKASIVLKYAGDSPILQANIDKETIMNDTVKFPLASELQEMLNNGSFTYEELVEKLGGVEGTISGKTSGSVSYMWVDKHSQVLRATFNNGSGKCTIASFR